MYGSRIRYQGKILGLAAGTGSVFSLLPPQNATGNWIKIVQRVPVRIALETEQLKKYPLRIGLSMEVIVDTHQRNGHILAQTVPSKPAYDTTVFNNQIAGAEALINKIIQENVSNPIS
jgi:membrane fusion protein (multidrug efflux system)